MDFYRNSLLNRNKIIITQKDCIVQPELQKPRAAPAGKPRDSNIKAQPFLPRKRPGRGPPSVREVARVSVTEGVLWAFIILPAYSSYLFIHLLSTLSLMPRRALPFLAKRKGSKRFTSLRGLTAKDSTQRRYVKRGLRLWKQQRKQSPPFRKLSPPHQLASALQLLEVTPIRQVFPLLNQQGSCIYPDRRRNASASLLAG